MKKNIISEVFFLRAIACLSIVLLHSISEVSDSGEGWIGAIRLLLAFGTPAFIIISEIVLANAYPSHTPKGFLKKRLLFIAIPYLSFVILYSLQDLFTLSGKGNAAAHFFKNFVISLFLGESPAYFVLIIFQFYLLHILFTRHVFNRFKPSWIVVLAGVVNVLYLAFFNLTSPPDNAIALYMWERFYRIPFLGWLFYFVVGYYLGKNYAVFLSQLNRLKYYVFALVPLTGFVSIYLLEQNIVPTLSSKRFDLILFTLSMAFMLLILASKFKTIPAFFVKISQYSFGIYLLHPFVLSVSERFLMFENNLVRFVVLFAITLGGSVITIALINRFPWGSYIVGRVGIGLNGKKAVKQPSRVSNRSLQASE
ncbi:acyltransferase family protein [Paenibacillus silvisoli]|uniref:acyltransferase family protein n=1 Tax=Paenibacillus silvisoli TaxID=3110539 RepID=UPI002803F2F4|nr:acyltransferase family protein [Paenibacillus silvisoli]